jgi:hypothetical protein
MMTDEEMMELLWEASKSGNPIRDAWLDEFIRHPEGKARIRELLADADNPTLSAVAELLHEFADAPRRNASKKRHKTQEAGVSWQRELASYLNREGPRTRLAKYRHIPDEHQEPLSLCGGKFEISRRRGESRSGSIGPLVRCEFDDGREPDEISFSTFERYLKTPRSR